MLFGTPHIPGALYHALEPFAKEGLNLTRIESYPVKEGICEYLFFLDFAGHRGKKETRKCLANMEKVVTFIKVLGSYAKGDEPW